jgi:hypothetical protein
MLYLPAAQSAHEEAVAPPATATNLPAAQAVHTVALMAA